MIHHVAIETRREDVEACAGFYELIGFARVEPPEALLDIAAWVQRGDQQIHLLYADAPVVPELGHLAVVCPDFDAVVDGLRRAGHRVQPHDPVWGAQRCYAFDPTGHRVEIMEFPPGG